MPTAAKMASSSVGGSRRTRRGPYLVFQSSLIGGLASDAGLPRECHVALQYEFDVANQLCTGEFSQTVQLLCIVDLDRWRSGRERAKRADEISRRRHGEMRCKRRAI